MSSALCLSFPTVERQEPEPEFLDNDAGIDAESCLPLVMTKNQYQAYRRARMKSDPHCIFCGRALRDDSATLDHLLPKSRGGLNHPWNLVLACGKCNGEKSGRLVTEWHRDILDLIAERQQFADRLAQLIDDGIDDSVNA